MVDNWRNRGPFLIPDALDTETCAGFRSYFMNVAPRSRSYQGIVDERLRKCDFVEITEEKLVWQANQIAEVASARFGATLRVVPGQNPLAYRYGAGIGFVTHHDEVTEAELERAKDNGQPVVRGDVTVTVSLSDPDEYDGGELYFVKPETTFKPRQGSAVTFPATRDFRHGVRQITEGTRYVLLLRFVVHR